MATKVGDTIYCKPTWNDKYVGKKIVSETKTMWLLHNGDTVNKHTMKEGGRAQYGYGREQYFTKEQMVNRQFCAKHARNLGHVVGVCDDAAKLREIARIVGKELE